MRHNKIKARYSNTLLEYTEMQRALEPSIKAAKGEIGMKRHSQTGVLSSRIEIICDEHVSGIVREHFVLNVRFCSTTTPALGGTL